MKTKMKVLLMSLCAAFIMLAGSGATVHAEGLSFDYAYDVQRDENLGVGYSIYCHYLDRPYSSETEQKDSKGKWTLTELGSYEKLPDNNIQKKTDSIASYAAGRFTDLKKEDVCIHELKLDGNHIAYGVIMASQGNNDFVVFVGDTLPAYSSGIGYLLSKIALSDSMTVRGDKTALNYAKRALSLTGTGSDIFNVGNGYGEFTFVEEEYGVLSAQLTVKNNSDAAINDLIVAIEGKDANCFELSKSSIDSIASEAGDTFAVTPKEGLKEGNYKATVVVKKSDNSIRASFNIYFSVKAPQAKPTPVAPTEPTPVAPTDPTPTPSEPTATPAPAQPTATPAPANNDSNDDDNDNDTVQETVAATPTPAPEVLYTVKKGDTLSKIARINGCSLRELMEANADLLQYRTLIYPNWVLKIPQNNALSMAAQDAQASGTAKLYKVQKGDSLWKIARNNHCTVKEIIDLNSITVQKADLIYPGWDLTLPEK